MFDSVAKRPLTVVSAGKAAVPMAAAFFAAGCWDLRAGLIAAPGTKRVESLERYSVGHPHPDKESAAAGSRALALAAGGGPSSVLVVLLSGGASAALVDPVMGLTLEDKIHASEALLSSGIAIDRVNCVRKHLSCVKGGWLAVAAPGEVVTLAVSDVVGPVADDPSVIGSGPTVADPTSFGEALCVVDTLHGGPFPDTARVVLERGRIGEIAETPKPGDRRLRGSRFKVIGSRIDAIRGAVTMASRLGYAVATIEAPITGEARVAGANHVERVVRLTREMPRPACIVSAGETTVHVLDNGRGGRNQEFALAAAEGLALHFSEAVLGSIGTDGVDGPTDASGAVIDTSTTVRAYAGGLGSPGPYLANNDSYTFFSALGDLMHLGPTETNVGDIQVALIA